MGKMRIVAICGSPRSRNTVFMLKEVLGNVKGEKEIVFLKDKRIKHCRGCSKCQETGECVIIDDAKELLKIVSGADAIILGSPTYFDNVSGIMKDFIDRSHPLYKDMKLKNKKAAIVVSGSGEMSSIKYAAEALERFAEIHGMKIVGTVMANEEHLRDKAVVAELRKLGEKLGE